MVIEAITSIRQQPCADLEIVVVDDGSTDGTRLQINSIFPDVLQVNLDGQGPGPARNAGVNAASGNILMFLDSDDIWLENHVQLLHNVMKKGFEFAYGTTETIDKIAGNHFLIPEKNEGIEGDCFNALTRWCFMVPSSIAVSRKAFSAVNGFDDIECGEDWAFFLKLAARYHFGFAGNTPITLRKLHRDSLCFLGDKKKLLDMLNHVFKLLEKIPGATAAHRDHFITLHKWTAANMDRWSTVQDWYLAMQKEKII